MKCKTELPRTKNHRASLGLIVALLLLTPSCTQNSGKTSLTVPSEYRTLYSELEFRLSEFETLLQSQPNKEHPIVFATELLPANAHRGEALFGEEAWEGIILYLDRLQSMGIQGVKVAIKYPVLSPDFPNSEKYLAFYKRLSDELKRRHMRMLAGTGPLFTDPTFTEVRVDYTDLTFEKLKRETREHITIIIQEIEPDYVTVANEPSTESDITGIALPPEKFIELVTYVLEGLDRKKTLVGAGAGNWDDPAYIEGLARETSVDYIDLHIYPVNRNFLARAVQDADTAAKYKKRIIIGECWLYKAGEREIGGASAADIISRDVFSFWQPLDAKFLELVVEFAEKKNVEFISPFWSKYFFAYVDYSKTKKGVSPRELLGMADVEASKSIRSNKLSQTGIAYRSLIASSD